MDAWLTNRLAPVLLRFLLNDVTAEKTLDVELELENLLQELGRELLEWAFNSLEPEEADAAPHDVLDGSSGYRRLNKKTVNRDVATLFGRITLHRRGYRSWDRDDGEPIIFPLERLLGLVEKTTPAMAGRIARRMAEAGATQNATLDWLRREHQLAIGAARLRRLCETVSAAVEEQRETLQSQQLLQWLEAAQATRGRHKPVLSVGRDGVSFHVQSVYEVGSTATLSVYGRDGKRIGTVYLAQPSEPYQKTLSRQLTRLIQHVLAEWNGPEPRLCYVTDAGDAETKYYREVLRPMCDPKRPSRRLEWIRVIDYFHASERIAIMAKAIKFCNDRDSLAWSRRMLKLLKKPGGAGRVLRSAASLAKRLGVKQYMRKEFMRATNYIRKRTQWMRYSEFQRKGLPIGSGVTEAACKTVFTQRLKLSGMQWKRAGAAVILKLRIALLSGIWDNAYRMSVQAHSRQQITVHAQTKQTMPKNAA
jgi:hypothetical protein